MRTFFSAMCFAGLLLGTAESAAAQKNIMISDSLAVHAEILPVKTGNAWPWKVYKFSFGDYGIASSKLGWGTSSSKSNFLGTKSQSRSAQKFSFVLTNKTDSARVDAAHNIMIRELQQINLFPILSWGSDELLEESNNFSALITINEDTSTTWALFIINVKGSGVENKYEAFLTNRERTIFLESTTSDKNSRRNQLLLAQGYEFIENGQSLGALQYFGGGMLGVSKKMIWIRKDLDANMKLILAAAMTAVMQFRM